MNAFEPWRRNLRLWLPALALFLAALSLLVFYRVALADDAELGQARLERLTQELEDLRNEKQRLTAYLERAAALEAGLDEFFGMRLASEAASLTRIIAEVKDLSRRAGLEPQQISYDRESIEGEGVMRRALVFPVRGTYQELRQLINFLELSDSFLILEEVRLRGDQDVGAELRIDLVVSTLFLEDDAGPTPVGDRS